MTHVSDTCAQVNSRKINDEPNVLEGVFQNKLFVCILASEFVLQASIISLYQYKACWLMIVVLSKR